MPLYRYKALNSFGKEEEGLIEADSFLLVKERLKGRKIFVTHIEEEKKRTKNISLNREALLVLTKELAQLLRAGLPLYESFVTIEEKSRKEKHHLLFIDIIDRLKQGENLSQVLKRHPDTFDPVYSAMIAAAEQSGALADAFSEVSIYLEKQAKWKKQITSMTVYPAFLLGFSFFIFFALLFFLIPPMEELYEGRSLHPLTSCILALSRFFRGHVEMLSLLVSLGGVLFFVLTRQIRIRKAIGNGLLNAPFIGDVLIQSKMARFARVMSLLLGSGITLIEALKLARPMLKSPIFEEALLYTEGKMLEGKSFHIELKERGCFPPLVIRLMAVAEETGKMREAFCSIADIYDEKLGSSLEKLSTVLQPALLFLLGIVVGVIILAVLLPLTDVSSFL